ncbi:hypothetical protein ACFOLC_08730 [Lysobacter cavernae]|uniref:Uncharacterized protein n=1 Tax=Lysobacter cavernae TaxID=1685901 RepID=A0ABV7RN92_9GAMM
MNASCRMAVLSLVSVLGLAACAGTQQMTVADPPGVQIVSMDDDAAYVARVEQLARRRGVEVVWVNPPRQALAVQDEGE